MSKRISLVALALIASLTLVFSCSEDEATGPEGESFGMDDAIAVVIDSILDDEVPAGSQYRCLRMDASIPAGSVIEEDVPMQNGGNGIALISPVTMQTTEESYFFLLDLAPAAFYAHDVKYITVGKSGDYTVEPAEWWPVINGQTPEQFLVSEPDEAYVVAANVNIKINPSQLPAFQIGPLFQQYKEGFIVIQGLMPDEALYSDAWDTYNIGIDFFTAYKGTGDLLDGMVDGAADNVLNMIDYFADEGVDIITIYIIAHGNVGYVRLGGYMVTALSFAAKMGEHPDVLFNMIVGSCHSGSFITPLSAVSNVRIVLTSCASDEGAKPDWDEAYGLTDHNPEDIGAEWMSSVLDAADIILGIPTAWTQILTWGSIEGVPPTCMLLYQAGEAALGEDDELGTFDNLDLSNRTGHTTPGFYCSW
jgi:hypothetical protein